MSFDKIYFILLFPLYVIKHILLTVSNSLPLQMETVLLDRLSKQFNTKNKISSIQCVAFGKTLPSQFAVSRCIGSRPDFSISLRIPHLLSVLITCSCWSPVDSYLFHMTIFPSSMLSLLIAHRLWRCIAEFTFKILLRTLQSICVLDKKFPQGIKVVNSERRLPLSYFFCK